MVPCDECDLAPDCPVRNNPKFAQDCVGADPDCIKDDPYLAELHAEDERRKADRREDNERRRQVERGLA